MTTTQPTERRVYGNFIEVKSPGIHGASLLGSLIVIGGFIVSVIAVAFGGFEVGLISVALCAIAFLLFATPVGDELSRFTTFTWQQINKENHYRSGMFGRSRREPTNRLPGMLARTQLLEGKTVAGEPFAVVKHPRGLYTITLACWADGPSMQSQQRIDLWVGGWAATLADFSRDRSLASAKAIMDTAPDHGSKLIATITPSRSKNSPTVARQVIDECLRNYPQASSDNVTYIELTYRGNQLSRNNKQDRIVTELARKIGNIRARLMDAGGGLIEPVTANQLAQIVRIAYDPAAAPALERVASSTTTDVEPLVSWHEAGPVAEHARWKDLLHDSGRSMTWEMVAPSKSVITEMALSELMSPHGDFARKRLALVYRPHTLTQGPQVSERDAKTMTFNSSGAGTVKDTAADQLARLSADTLRKQVAGGATLTRFTLLVTATVAHDGDMEQAASTVEQQWGRASFQFRPCYGSQSAAFATTLPVGFTPWEHTVINADVTEAIK